MLDEKIFRAMPFFTLDELEREEVLGRLKRVESPSEHELMNCNNFFCLARQLGFGRRLFQCDHEGVRELQGLLETDQYDNPVWYQGDPAEVYVASEPLFLEAHGAQMH